MRRILPAVLTLGALATAACGGGGSSGATQSVAITATDTACELARTTLTAGTTRFDIANKGKQVTEVYVYAPGDKVVAEREDIGPGTSTQLTVKLDAGKYQVACKPGMKGGGIRHDITVGGG